MGDAPIDVLLKAHGTSFSAQRQAAAVLGWGLSGVCAQNMAMHALALPLQHASRRAVSDEAWNRQCILSPAALHGSMAHTLTAPLATRAPIDQHVASACAHRPRRHAVAGASLHVCPIPRTPLVLHPSAETAICHSVVYALPYGSLDPLHLVTTLPASLRCLRIALGHWTPPQRSQALAISERSVLRPSRSRVNTWRRASHWRPAQLARALCRCRAAAAMHSLQLSQQPCKLRSPTPRAPSARPPAQRPLQPQ